MSRARRGSKLQRMKLTPSTQIAHVDGIWIETSSALRDCNIRTLADHLAMTPTAIPEQQLALLLEAAEGPGWSTGRGSPTDPRRHEPVQFLEPVEDHVESCAGCRAASFISTSGY